MKLFVFSLLALVGTVAAAANPCPNLTGHWQIKCADQDKNAFTFERDYYQKGCEELHMNGRIYVIGQATTHQWSSPKWDKIVNVASFDWNADHSRLQYTSSYHARNEAQGLVFAEISSGAFYFNLDGTAGSQEVAHFYARSNEKVEEKAQVITCEMKRM